MAILKALPKQPKTTVVQLRPDEEAPSTLAKYAEYLECSPSHIVTEALPNPALICLGHKKINLSTVFAGQAVGIKEVHDDI